MAGRNPQTIKRLRGGVVRTVLRASLSSDSLHQPFLPSPAGEFELAYSIGRSKTGKTSGELAICNW